MSDNIFSKLELCQSNKTYLTWLTNYKLISDFTICEKKESHFNVNFRWFLSVALIPQSPK